MCMLHFTHPVLLHLDVTRTRETFTKHCFLMYKMGIVKTVGAAL